MSQRYLGISFLLGAVLSIILVPSAEAVPSFARQTGLACDACHTSYPNLTKLGREFKLNGYQMDGLAQVSSSPSQKEPGLSINKIPNLSLLVAAAEKGINTSLPHNENPSANFPAAVKFYYAGRVAHHLGAFVDAVYKPGSVGLDNAELRFAHDTKLFSKPTIWGINLGNGPALEDVWNDTPHWSMHYPHFVPYIKPFIDKAIGQTVGAGAYQYWNGLVYTYVGIFQAAQLGYGPMTNLNHGQNLSGASPYYRIAFTPLNNFEVGTFGYFANFHPNLGKPVGREQRYSDIGVDSQYQWYPNKNNILSFHATYIHQLVSGLDETVPNYSGSDALKTNYFNINGNWYYQHRYGLSVGFFYTQGDKSKYYSDVYGNSGPAGYRSITEPNTEGETARLQWFPWQNVRLSFMYTAFNKFHGASDNYNGRGRNASDNNTYMLHAMVGF